MLAPLVRRLKSDITKAICNIYGDHKNNKIKILLLWLCLVKILWRVKDTLEIWRFRSSRCSQLIPRVNITLKKNIFGNLKVCRRRNQKIGMYGLFCTGSRRLHSSAACPLHSPIHWNSSQTQKYPKPLIRDSDGFRARGIHFWYHFSSDWSHFMSVIIRK